MSKDSSIFYKSQIDICKRHLNAEQFGRLMYALFELDEGANPEVDEDIIIAFEFMSLQKKLDREKYEERCRKNRENGKKGGRPKTEKSERLLEKPNGYFKNPNDNENDNENDNDNDNENENDISVIKGLPDGMIINPKENRVDLTHINTPDELKAFLRGKQ